MDNHYKDLRRSTPARGVLRVLPSRFSRGAWLTLGSLSVVGPTEFNPPRYPKDEQVFDLDDIGHDMYRAFEHLSEETETIKSG